MHFQMSAFSIILIRKSSPNNMDIQGKTSEVLKFEKEVMCWLKLVSLLEKNIKSKRIKA